MDYIENIFVYKSLAKIKKIEYIQLMSPSNEYLIAIARTLIDRRIQAGQNLNTKIEIDLNILNDDNTISTIFKRSFNTNLVYHVHTRLDGHPEINKIIDKILKVGISNTSELIHLNQKILDYNRINHTELTQLKSTTMNVLC